MLVPLVLSEPGRPLPTYRIVELSSLIHYGCLAFESGLIFVCRDVACNTIRQSVEHLEAWLVELLAGSKD
jgi:hypothetical protein